MNKKIMFMLLIGQSVLATSAFSQNIAINEKGDLPDTSAMLDVSSSTKGFLAPRMTTIQQNAIKLPAKGLLVYNISSGTFNVNNGTPASPSWEAISGSASVTNTIANPLNTITSTVNNVPASATVVNAVGNISTTNSMRTTVNGVTGSAVPIVNSNTLTLSGNSLVSTVNGVGSTALDITPAMTLKTWGLSGNAGTTAGTNFIGTSNAIDFVTKTNGSERMRISSTGNVGIGTSSPTNLLHVEATENPLKLTGVQSGAATDSVLSINTSTGVVRLLSTSRFTVSGGSTTPSSGTGWSTSGNSGTTSSSYIGTSDGQPFVIKVNGTQAGYLGVSGSSFATAFGVGATAGFQSTAIGASATATANNEAAAFGYSATAAGYRSIAIGSRASAGNTNEAIAIGASASSASYQGIAIGSGATANTQNAALAIGMGSTSSGYQATAIGNGARATGQNATAIGNGATATSDNYIAIGNSSVTLIRGQVNFTTYSDGRFKKNIKADVPGLDFILKLRPVTYNWDIHKFNAHNLGSTMNAANAKYVSGSTQDEDAIRRKERITYTGFIAQEVETAANSTHFNFSGLLKPQDDKDAYSLSYAEFVVPLVKSVQELSKQNELLNEKINSQQQSIDLLIKEIKALKK